MSLTPKQARFVAEYLLDLNGTQAAIRTGYSSKTADVQASRLLANAKVQAAVQEAMDKRAIKTEITAERVLAAFWAIGTADPGELVQYRRVACPACGDLPSERTPNPDCAECHGEGVGQAFVADTRTLSPEGKALYAGVKVTKDGFEVKMHDKVAALTQVGRHLGMFTDHHEHTGKNGGPIAVETHELTDRMQALSPEKRAALRAAIKAIMEG